VAPHPAFGGVGGVQRGSAVDERLPMPTAALGVGHRGAAKVGLYPEDFGVP